MTRPTTPTLPRTAKPAGRRRLARVRQAATPARTQPTGFAGTNAPPQSEETRARGRVPAGLYRPRAVFRQDGYGPRRGFGGKRRRSGHGGCPAAIQAADRATRESSRATRRRRPWQSSRGVGLRPSGQQPSPSRSDSRTATSGAGSPRRVTSTSPQARPSRGPGRAERGGCAGGHRNPGWHFPGTPAPALAATRHSPAFGPPPGFASQARPGPAAERFSARSRAPGSQVGVRGRTGFGPSWADIRPAAATTRRGAVPGASAARVSARPATRRTGAGYEPRRGGLRAGMRAPGGPQGGAEPRPGFHAGPERGQGSKTASGPQGRFGPQGRWVAHGRAVPKVRGGVL